MIASKGQADATVTFQFTKHGPVIYQNDTHIFAVRAAWLDAGMAPYFGSVEYMRASNWREFVAALNRWGAPSENQVFADTDGNIGYKPVGLFPNRPNWDGLLPVPGGGRYEWDGYHDMDVLPEEFNHERGFSASANSMNLPAEYPIEKYTTGLEWTEPWRYNRVMSTLSSQPKHSLEESTALQRDYRSLLAVDILARIPDDIDGPAAAMLRDWDAVLSPDSSAAALYVIWLDRHLTPALQEKLVPDNPSLVTGLGGFGIMRMMDEPGGTDIINATLIAAYDETRSILGSDPSRWRLG